MQELYRKLTLLSSKTQKNKYEEIYKLLWIEYDKCLSEDMYDFNSLREMLQDWADKNNHDSIIINDLIIKELFENIKINNIFKLINEENVEISYDYISELLEKNSLKTMSFFDLTKKDVDLKGNKEEDIIVGINEYINYFSIMDNQKVDIIPALVLIASSCKLCEKLNRFDYLTRAIMMPFISTLYKNGFTQNARDQAETFYLYLIEHNQNHLAFLIHAHVYSFQKIPHLTAINLTLSIIFAMKYNDFSDEYFFEINTIYLRMLRDAKLYEFLNNFYKNNILKSDNDRFILSSSLIYIHGLFHTNQQKALTYTIEILNKYRELLFRNEHEAITSWLNVIFNLINIDKKNEKEFSFYMEMFKRVIGEEKYLNLYSMVFPTETTPQILKNMLPKVLDITFDSDIGYDINNSAMTAKKLIKNAYEKQSFEEIYLCLFYLMSPEFVREYSIKNKTFSIMYSNEKIIEPDFILKNFEDRLKDFVKNLNGEIIILLTTSEYIYQIIIDDNGISSMFEIKLDEEEIYDWINKNSTILEVKDINEYELFELPKPSKNQIESKNEINNKTQIRLNITNSPKNINIFRSFNNSFFPHNFYKDEKGDFLSLKQSLTLNLSIDESYSKDLNISNNIGLWAPCESGDYTINMLYSRIEGFHEKNKIKLNSITSVLPTEKLLNDIAVVITHGSSNIDETNKVYFVEDDLQIELTNILKENKVIILFVCHSGKQSLSDYSYGVDSIIKNLLKNQTKAIIAPCWPLSIDIAFFYYKMFVAKLYQKFSLGDIHFQIMKEMSERNINPAVWGNLHYYGNPNIYVE